MTLEPTKQPRRRWIRAGLAVLGASVLLITVCDLLVERRPVAYERGSAEEPFRRVSGSVSGAIEVGARYVYSDSEVLASRGVLARCGRPTNLSSWTILDVTGSDLSRELAHELMGRIQRLPWTRFVEVRHADDPSSRGRMGEVVLFVEEFEPQQGGLLALRNVDFSVVCGADPAVGWTEPVRQFPRWDAEWKLESSLRVFSLPTQRNRAIADSLADGVDLLAVFQTVAEQGPIVEAFHGVLLPGQFEAPRLDTVLDAMGDGFKPMLQGTRIARKAEGWWRYLAPDVVPRLESAVEELKSQGWTEADGWGRGVDGRLHHAILRNGSEVVDLRYQEGRSSRYIQESWTTLTTPDGKQMPTEHHVEGAPIDEALWLHYWNECTVDELAKHHVQLKAIKPAQAPAFLAALPFSTQVELGVPRDTLPKRAFIPRPGE